MQSMLRIMNISIYKTVYLQITLPALLLLFFGADAASLVEPTQVVSKIQDCDSRIRSLQSDLLALSASIERLQSDSIQAISTFYSVHNKNQVPLSETEKNLSIANNKISELKAQLQNTRTDSIQLAKQYADDMAGFQREMKRVELLLATATQDLAQMKQKREQLTQAASQTSNQTILSIKAEQNGIDMSSAKKTQELAEIKPRLEKLTQDSLNQANLLDGEKAKAQQQINMYDSLVERATRHASEAAQKLADTQNRLNQNQSAHLQTVKNFTSEKSRVVSSLTQLNAQITNAENERKKLRATAGELQSRYENGRSSFVNKINVADSTLQTRNLQLELWNVMKEKFSIDSAVSTTRNELDELIQQSASGKKAARKLIEPKEEQLNDLLGKRDLFMQKPGVQNAEKQLTSLTLSQRKARIQIITNITDNITEMTTQKMQAQQQLTEFERANPISKDPAVIRLRAVDSTIQSLNSQFTFLNSKKDSLDLLITNEQAAGNRDAAAFQKEIHSLDNASRIAAQEKATVTSQREQARKVLSDIHNKALSVLSKLSTDISSVRNTLLRIETELTTSANRKQQLTQNLALAEQNLQQQKLKASQDLQSLEMQISDKEQTITSLSSENNKTAQQIASAQKDFQMNLSVLQKTMQQLETLLATQIQEVQQLKFQQTSLQQEIAAAEQEQRKQQASILSSRLSIQNQKNAKQLEISRLQKERENALQTLIQEKERLSRTASVLTQQIMDKNNELQSVNSKQTAVELAISSVMVPPPAQSAPVASKPRDPQKLIEKIYTLVGEEKESEAFALFSKNKAFLKSSTAREVFDALQSIFPEKQISPTAQKK